MTSIRVECNRYRQFFFNLFCYPVLTVTQISVSGEISGNGINRYLGISFMDLKSCVLLQKWRKSILHDTFTHQFLKRKLNYVLAQRLRKMWQSRYWIMFIFLRSYFGNDLKTVEMYEYCKFDFPSEKMKLVYILNCIPFSQMCWMGHINAFQ